MLLAQDAGLGMVRAMHMTITIVMCERQAGRRMKSPHATIF
jgi:hypothetical protein